MGCIDYSRIMNMTGSAAVVGAGPNGLAAAVTLARAGVPVTVFETAPVIGGGLRTTDTVEPGVVHDVCAAIHPLALATGFFKEFELRKRVQFVVPDASYAHPLDTGPAAIAYRDLARTVHELGYDGRAYGRMYSPLLQHLDGLVDFAFGGSMLRLPNDPVATARFASRVLEQGTAAWNLRFRGEPAAALVTGAVGHSNLPTPRIASAAIGLILGALGHASGWPVPEGGSQSIADALAADLRAHGGLIETGHEITDVRELDGFDTKFFATSAQALARVAHDKLPMSYRRKLAQLKPGSGVCKVDFVLNGPVPWNDPRVHDAATVHVGGSRVEIAAAESQVSRGHHADHPFIVLAQPTHFDALRNPPGRHAVWSYAHVPNGSTVDISEQVIAQIERFATGFRDRILGTRVTTAAEYSRYNSNYVGGDISGGAVSLPQLIRRPTLSSHPWRTPIQGVYLVSSATAPGPGVHGLSGWYAAQDSLERDYGLPSPGLGYAD